MILGHRRHSTAEKRASVDESAHDTTEDETVVDSEQGNILMHIISQLRPGADLSRVTLPTFILEPRSMLERITNFMAHPETLLPMPKIDDPVERFVSVVKFYLSGWHIKPPGVKKPLNPIIGEIFTCYWTYPDQTRGFYIAEQTSHHPPKSSYFFMAPEHNIRIDGTLKPRSKFLGNSAASMMEGLAVMRFLNRGERYFVTQPNMYARGILFGKLKYELGDHSFVRCPETGLMADIEFKTKGYFGGTYNAIGGVIKDTRSGKDLFELSGLWTADMFIKDLATQKKTLLFSARGARETYPSVRPLEEQEERESQNLWQNVTAAVKNKDHQNATDEKFRIEDRQREEAARRADDGIDWRPRLFRRVQGGPGGSEEGEEDLDWIINAKIDGKTPEEQTKQILSIAAILPGQSPRRRFSIPQRKSLDRVPTRHSLSKSSDPHSPTQAQQAQSPTSQSKSASPSSPNGSLSSNLTKVTSSGRPHAVSVAESDKPQIQQNPPGAPAAPAGGGHENLLKQATKGLAEKVQHLNLNVNDENKEVTQSLREGASEGADVNKPLPAVPQLEPSLGIKRQDSETGEVDEFQDAED